MFVFTKYEIKKKNENRVKGQDYLLIKNETLCAHRKS